MVNEHGFEKKTNLTQRKTKKHKCAYCGSTLLQPSIEPLGPVESLERAAKDYDSQSLGKPDRSNFERVRFRQQNIEHAVAANTEIPRSEEMRYSAASNRSQSGEDIIQEFDRNLPPSPQSDRSRCSQSSSDVGSNSPAVPNQHSDSIQHSDGEQSSDDGGHQNTGGQHEWYEDQFMSEVKDMPLKRQRKSANFYAEKKLE
ncbi:hypothetical protein OPT61_g4860 [Boeremia exigua]|uniref:Uncharacterized protein n=1 Tax=Boeremia exigua TaxID=749465 RepID=A0ACC2ICF0_9PLEO|nr:hypothetical protein OPT61_g4860 [Boeremia exigua]